MSMSSATMPAIEARAVLPPGSWRDARVYAALAATGARGLAWELLRRNPEYSGGAAPGDGPLIVADADRKSVGWGKSLSVRVDLGGRRIIKKKKKHINSLNNARYLLKLSNHHQNIQ